jgi:hypothetical protein
LVSKKHYCNSNINAKEPKEQVVPLRRYPIGNRGTKPHSRRASELVRNIFE